MIDYGVPKYFSAINACKYLYLKEICEPEDNSLRLLLAEAVDGDELKAIGSTGLSGRAMQVTNESRVFAIYFDSYIGYSVIDESLALPDDSEIFEGRLFCVYSKSNYLNYLLKAAVATSEHPGPFAHYGFNCLNHVVNVVSADEPQIKKVIRSDQ